MDDSELGTATTTIEEKPEPKPALATGGKGGRRRGRIRGIGLLYREVAGEMRKVLWPTRRELISYTAVVLVFVTMMIIIVAGLDFGFTKAVLAVFG